MAKLTRNLTTGSALFLALAGCLAFTEPARAETEIPPAMAAEPTPMEPVGVVPVVWPMAPEAESAETLDTPRARIPRSADWLW